MIDQRKIQLFQDLYNQSESILIVYAGDALRDHLFAATALYKTIQQNTNKSVSLLSSKDLSKAEPEVVYLDETRTEIGNQNLCISLDYDLDSVEKITSSIDEPAKKLHITIKPKKGISPISKESVSLSYTGADADMIVLIGVDDLESLDQLYYGYEAIYQKSALVSINSYETTFGNLKLDILGSSSTCEYILQLMRSFEYKIDHETATNLLAGIDEETDNLESYIATADTFEVVSILLRHGARRFAREKQDSQPVNESFDIKSKIMPVKHSEQIEQTEQVEQIEINTDFSDEVLVVQQEEPTLVETSEKNSTQEKPKNKQRRRGRPKGSKNRKTSTTQKKKPANTSDASKTKDQPKPGDLNYVPSGIGPSTT